MNNLRPTGPLDELARPDGDRFFIGVDERRSPKQLEEGLVSSATNCRFREGKASTRLGAQICRWMKGDGTVPWTEVYGGCVFADPNQAGDWIIIAADNGVWRTRPNMTAKAVPLPGGISLTADTFKMFVTCNDGGNGVLVLLRGDNADPLVCVDLDLGFTTVPAHGGGTRNMPRSGYGINCLNRLLLIEGRDGVAASDILAYKDFRALATQYRLNSGDSQKLIRLEWLPNKTLLGFKSQRTYQVSQVQNLTDGSLDGIGPDDFSSSAGIAGPFGFCRNNRQFYWLTAEPAIATGELTMLNQAQATEHRLSDPMRQTFGRIQPGHLSGAAMELWNGRLYVALPLDDAVVKTRPISFSAPAFGHYQADVEPGHTYRWTPGGTETTLTNGSQDYSSAIIFTAVGSVVTTNVSFEYIYDATLEEIIYGNNGVAVFDFVNQAWAGVDQAAGVFAVKAFLKTAYQGRERLFILGSDGALRLYEEGYEDEVFDANGNIVTQAITMAVTTRGYFCGDPDRKRYTSGAFMLRTWNPRYTLESRTQGLYTDATEQAAVTRSTTRYQQHNTPDWNPDNSGDDHALPGREDYSVTLNDPTGINPGTNGFAPDLHQVSTERTPLAVSGHYAQISISNDQGRLELMESWLETQTSERTAGATVL